MRVLWSLLVLTACGRVLQLDLRDAPPIDVAIDGPLPATWNTPQGDLALPIGIGDDPTLSADLLELYWNTSTLDISQRGPRRWTWRS